MTDRFMQRLQACEASGWGPLVEKRIRYTRIFHAATCGLNLRRVFCCDCEGEIYVILKDGQRFSIGLDGTPRREKGG